MYDPDQVAVVEPRIGPWKSMVSRGKGLAFEKLDASPFLLFPTAKDKAGRSVVVLAPSYLGIYMTKTPLKTFCYTASRLDDLFESQSPISLIVCFNASHRLSLRDPDFGWLTTFLGYVPSIHRTSIEKIYFIDPTPTTQAEVAAMKTVASKHFVEGFSSLTSMEEVLQIFDPASGPTIRFLPQLAQASIALVNGTEVPRVLGVSLDELSGRQGRDCWGCRGVPEVLISFALAFQEPETLKVKNLLNQQSDLTALKKALNVLESADSPTVLSENVAALATAFRVFLGSLPTPLLGDSAFEVFTMLAAEKDTVDTTNSTTSTSSSSGVARSSVRLANILKRLISQLSLSGRESLQFILTLTDVLIQHQNWNEMSSQKIAEILSPCFAKPNQWSSSTPKTFKTLIDAISLLVSTPKVFFPDIQLRQKNLALRRPPVHGSVLEIPSDQQQQGSINNCIASQTIVTKGVISSNGVRLGSETSSELLDEEVESVTTQQSSQMISRSSFGTKASTMKESEMEFDDSSSSEEEEEEEEEEDEEENI